MSTRDLPQLVGLVERGAAVGRETEAGETPLMMAGWWNEVAVLKLLLARPGVDVNQETALGATALSEALRHCSFDCADVLLAAGALVSRPNALGETPLHQIISGGPRLTPPSPPPPPPALRQTGPPVAAAGSQRRVGGAAAAVSPWVLGDVQLPPATAMAGATAKRRARTPSTIAAEVHPTEDFVAAGDVLHATEWLLEHGAAVDVESVYGHTPLMYACAHGLIDVVRALLSGGANSGWRGRFSTPLTEALAGGYVNIADALYAAGATDMMLTARTGEIALLMLATAGNLEGVQWMLRHTGAPGLGFVSPMGSTPLIAAARVGMADVVEVLIGAGSLIDVETDSNVTAMIVAARGGHTRICGALARGGGSLDHETRMGMTPLIAAAIAGLAETVGYLTDLGCRLNEPTVAGGVTALIEAARCQRAGVIEVLLRKGAKVAIVGSNGDTAIEAAIAQCDERCIVALLDADGAWAYLRSSRARVLAAATKTRNRRIMAIVSAAMDEVDELDSELLVHNGRMKAVHRQMRSLFVGMLLIGRETWLALDNTTLMCAAARDTHMHFPYGRPCDACTPLCVA